MHVKLLRNAFTSLRLAVVSQFSQTRLSMLCAHYDCCKEPHALVTDIVAEL